MKNRIKLNNGKKKGDKIMYEEESIIEMEIRVEEKEKKIDEL